MATAIGRATMKRAGMLAASLLILVGLIGSHAGTAVAQSVNRGPSGLPLPRFVSLDADKVNMRVGPGLDYSISWRYLRSGVPMEIIQEYDNWRKVRDAEGADGWIHEALLSGDRTALVSPWAARGEGAAIEMRSEKEGRGQLVAQLRPGVVIKVRSCDGSWCEAAVKGLEGFVAQKELWGAYPGEVFN